MKGRWERGWGLGEVGRRRVCVFLTWETRRHVKFRRAGSDSAGAIDLHESEVSIIGRGRRIGLKVWECEIKRVPLCWFNVFLFLLFPVEWEASERGREVYSFEAFGEIWKRSLWSGDECLRERLLEGGDVGRLNLVSSSECNQPEVQLLPPSAAHLSGHMFREGE